MEKSLEREFYFSDEIFHQELESIFYSDWICCGREEDLDSTGSYKIFSIGNENLFAIKDKNNDIKIFHNFCKHRGCQIFEDEESSPLKRNIRCPYHSWVYNFDGSLYKAPHLDLDTKDKKFHLNQVSSETWGGFIFINLSKNPSSFKKYIKNISDQFIRYPLSELVSSRSYRYEVEANWKVIVENYNECYHCAGVHPELVGIVPAFKDNGANGLDWDKGIPHRTGANTFTFSGTTNRDPMPGL
ncbi:MAG: aromatic ring-hydroxylating oxygenase subunit alpha, partial [Gammaproteobacteria bacterium]